MCVWEVWIVDYQEEEYFDEGDEEYGEQLCYCCCGVMVVWDYDDGCDMDDDVEYQEEGGDLLVLGFCSYCVFLLLQ